ncbi:MAG: nucleotidyltransferase domain-containing protein [Alphaproteobacteria bacterium]|nr:nucleotidyltransferase domain-containing protein [Alphaproteobacteria bacterium]
MYDYRSDPFVAETAKAVRALYGEKLKGLMLYGSRARGDATPDSDYDFLVLLDDPIDWIAERRRLSSLSLDLELRTGEDAFFMPETPEALQRRTLFMGNVRKDAVRL